MSETKQLLVPEETVKKLKYISGKFKKLNTGNKSREFWIASGGNSENYEWDQFDVGIDDEGNLITCSQGGCSCNSPEQPTADTKHVLIGVIDLGNDDIHGDGEDWLGELIKTTDTLYTLFKEGKFDSSSVLELSNAEIRRAVIEYIGLDKFLRKANPEVLDENEWGKLVKIKVPEPDEDIVAVYVKDASTSRSYFLRVPPKIKTSKEAVSWTFSLKEETYNPTEQA